MPVTKIAIKRQVVFSIGEDNIVLYPKPVDVEDSFGLVSSTHTVGLTDMDLLIREQTEK